MANSRVIGPVCETMGLGLGAFTQQAHNLIVLSEDETRMLGQPFVGLSICCWRSAAMEMYSLLAERGLLGPSTEHLLLALSAQQLAAGILRDVGVDDSVALVDGVPGDRRPPVTSDALKRSASGRVASSAPRPGPVPRACRLHPGASHPGSSLAAPDKRARVRSAATGTATARKSSSSGSGPPAAAAPEDRHLARHPPRPLPA